MKISFLLSLLVVNEVLGELNDDVEMAADNYLHSSTSRDTLNDEELEEIQKTHSEGTSEGDAQEAIRNATVIRPIGLPEWSSWNDLAENTTNWIDLSEDLCRTRDGRFLPPPLFAKDTCTFCYLFEIGKNSAIDSPLKEERRIYTSNGESFTVFVLVPRNSSSRTPIDTSLTHSYDVITNKRIRNNWKNCCFSSLRCCSLMRMKQEGTPSSYCPRTWDGWQCWPDTPPNTEQYEICPTYSYIHTVPSCQKSATKFCTEDGKWLTRKGREWTDYSSCGELQSIRLRLTFHVGSIALSMLALIPALFIFYSYRQLRVYRITLHKHLFMSLLLEACCSMSFRLLQLFDMKQIEESPPWCTVLCLIQKYARQTNYMWYFCEGFYLHKLLAAAFAEQNNIVIFYAIGWGIPIIPVGAYGILRALWYENSHCWTIPVDGLEYLIQLPPLFAMLMNLIFIINIIRILLMKVRCRHEHEPSQFRMAVRACMMVIPLFGLQYVVTIYRPNVQACSWIDVYHIMNNVIDGSTGLLVAIIFCYSNTEVQTLLKRSWRHLSANYDDVVTRKTGASKSKSFQTLQTTVQDDQPKPILADDRNERETARHEQEYTFNR